MLPLTSGKHTAQLLVEPPEQAEGHYQWLTTLSQDRSQSPFMISWAAECLKEHIGKERGNELKKCTAMMVLCSVRSNPHLYRCTSKTHWWA